MGHDNINTGVAAGVDEAGRLRSKDGFLDIEDAAFGGESAKEMLRALIDEIPTQVRKTNQVGGAGINCHRHSHKVCRELKKRMYLRYARKNIGCS